MRDARGRFECLSSPALWLIPQILRLAGQSNGPNPCFAEETQGKENMHGDSAYGVGFGKPLQERAKLVDKLREICAVVPVNQGLGNGCSGNA